MIITMTVFERIDTEKTTNLPTFGDRRCLGFFTTIEEAMHVLSTYPERIHNKQYDYCVLEEYRPGIFLKSDNRYFYKWSSEKQQYLEIDEDKQVHKVTNFGIG